MKTLKYFISYIDTVRVLYLVSFACLSTNHEVPVSPRTIFNKRNIPKMVMT